MADHAHSADAPAMDYAEHERTYVGFVHFAEVGTVAVHVVRLHEPSALRLPTLALKLEMRPVSGNSRVTVVGLPGTYTCVNEATPSRGSKLIALVPSALPSRFSTVALVASMKSES